MREKKFIYTNPPPDKPLDEELREEGFTPVGPEYYNPSDEGAVAQSLENRRVVEEIFEERPLRLARISPRQQRILRKRFIDGRSPKEVGLEEDPPVAASRIDQIEGKSVRKLKKLLPQSQRREQLNLFDRQIAKSLVIDYFYPNDPNRFLMVEYLFDYFLKNGFGEFTSDEMALLSHARNTSKQLIETQLTGSLQPAQSKVLIKSVFGKIRRILRKKFDKIA